MAGRNFEITKAVKENLKARISISAPAGSGKTTQALILAEQLAEDGRILVIDTERRSASLYADKFDFHTIDFERPYAALQLADLLDDVGGSFDVIIIDSLSHFWSGEGGVLSVADGRATGWKEATPMQDRMVDAILSVPCHIIATTRSKTQTALEQDSNGRMKVRTHGMKIVQRDEIIYEFTIAASIDKETHAMSIEKSRMPSIQDGKFQTFGDIRKLGTDIKNWLSSDDALRAETEMRETVADQLDEAAQAAGILTDEDVQAGTISPDQLDQIRNLFAGFPESERNGLMGKFAAEMGNPNNLLLDDFDEAMAFAVNLIEEEASDS